MLVTWTHTYNSSAKAGPRPPNTWCQMMPPLSTPYHIFPLLWSSEIKAALGERKFWVEEGKLGRRKENVLNWLTAGRWANKLVDSHKLSNWLTRLVNGLTDWLANWLPEQKLLNDRELSSRCCMCWISFAFQQLEELLLEGLERQKSNPTGKLPSSYFPIGAWIQW